MCIKLYHSSTWHYKQKMEAHSRLIHFCALCIYFLCEKLCWVGTCRIEVTCGRIYAAGLKGMLVHTFFRHRYYIFTWFTAQKSWFRCGFIQWRPFFFCITMLHTVGGNIWNVIQQLPPSSWYICVYDVSEMFVPDWLKNKPMSNNCPTIPNYTRCTS